MRHKFLIGIKKFPKNNQNLIIKNYKDDDKDLF